MRLLCLAILVLAVLYAKSTYAKTDSQAKPRASEIDSIIIHSVGGPYCKDGRVLFSSARSGLLFWQGFFAKQPVIGIHYLIARDGSIVSSISEAKVANHALGWNLRSIGIELLNAGDGVEPYSHLQTSSLIALVKNIMARNPQITAKKVLRHSDVDSRFFGCDGLQVKRKQDPGAMFDYQGLLKAIS